MKDQLKLARDRLRQAKAEYAEAEEALFARSACRAMQIPHLLVGCLQDNMEELEGILTSPEMRASLLKLYVLLKEEKSPESAANKVVKSMVKRGFDPFSLMFNPRVLLKPDPEVLVDIFPDFPALVQQFRHYTIGLIGPIKQHLSTADSELLLLFEDFEEKDRLLQEAQDELYQAVCDLD